MLIPVTSWRRAGLVGALLALGALLVFGNCTLERPDPTPQACYSGQVLGHTCNTTLIQLVPGSAARGIALTYPATPTSQRYDNVVAVFRLDTVQYARGSTVYISAFVTDDAQPAPACPAPAPSYPAPLLSVLNVAPGSCPQ
ncbi:hypothetical protein [Hymenobacter rigui]|uniref:Uncharacterized protein n=1 Tax=Hymenobacter rigui TaxID=334424 RepID=A0A3R9MJJ1_9BACT|nr:hypothetical protein [Hymenobacter rigui]RSK47362.1 hypothetical protein EI291_15725 [Hymenobacter rigui]